MKEPNNSISLIGNATSDLFFSHSVNGLGLFKFHIAVKRLSGNIDVLPVTVPEFLLKNLEINEGRCLSLKGQIRSYYSNIKNENHRKLTLTVYTKEIVEAGQINGLNPNELFLDGLVYKQPTWRITPLGKIITEVMLRIKRAEKEFDYIPCIAWGRTAKEAYMLNPGERVQIWGRFQSRLYIKRYENGDENEKTAYEVSIFKLKNNL